MTSKNYILSIIIVGVIIFTACKKSNKNEEIVSTTETLTTDIKKEIVNEMATNVIAATYYDLYLKASGLYNAVNDLNSSTTDQNLTTCKQAWKDTRLAWEQSEGFLFGPVATQNIDPRIDTWPVNYQTLDSVLNSTATFNNAYINSLEDALKGFHPIEYLLFGTNGNKTASQFTQREKEFLIALCENVKSLTNEASTQWNTATSGNYISQFTTAGAGSTIYQTQRSVYEEIVNAMIHICDEVANGKIMEPFTQQDPKLEESPFSFNSITDFTNNMKSVQNVYIGKYTVDGKGLEDLIKAHNLSLDGNVKTKINNAIAALNNITVPFGQAIIHQPVQVQNAIDAINALKSELETNLLPFVQQYTN